MELPDRGKVLSALRNCKFHYVLSCHEAVKGKCPYGSRDCATHRAWADLHGEHEEEKRGSANV